MSSVFIYALVHPVTKEIRYVGKANDMRKRLSSHLRDSRSKHRPVCFWISKLTAQGLCPEMIVLEKCETEDWKQSEILWISKLRPSGRLLNLSDGGDMPGVSVDVRRRNGALVAKQTHGNPELREIWELKHRAGLMVKYLMKNSTEERVERFKKAMRHAAKMKPDTFGSWAAI